MVKERVVGRSPLFQVMLVLINTPEVPKLKLGELVLSAETYEQTTAKFDLTFFIKETKDGFHGTVEYNADLYSDTRIEAMASQLQRDCLQSIVAGPQTAVGKLSMLTKGEQIELSSFEQSLVTYPKDQTIAQLFEQQAAKHPDTIALTFEETQLSYKSLNERSNQLAHHLRGQGVKAGMLHYRC